MENEVFKRSTEWWKNAIVSESDVTKYAYSFGYKKAGDILAEKVLNDRFMIDALFLPICYCYRHFIEVSLKESIIEVTLLINGGRYGSLEGIECDLETLKKLLEGKNGHNLKWLWEELEKRMDAAIEPRDKEWDEKIKGYILAFHQLDEKSQAFRYPLDKKTGEMHFKGERHYDIEHIQKCAKEIEMYFNGLDGYVSQLNDFDY